MVQSDEDRAAHERDEDYAGATDDESSHRRSSSDEEFRLSASADSLSEPRLGSRILVTWIELTVVGITGGLLGATVGGPPGFIIYLATTLVTVGIIFYNVNELIRAWMRRSNRTDVEEDT